MFSKQCSHHVISLNGDFQLRARLPDVNTCDFFWGYLKSKVYANPPRSITELEQNMRDEVAEIPVKIL
jgi:hypothetical protein